MEMKRIWNYFRVFAAILSFYLLLLIASRQLDTFASRNPSPVFGPGTPPLLIAHQGGNLERPDETIASFDHGRDSGADVLEMDVHPTADDFLAVLHDSRVDRTTDGLGLVSDLTMAEIHAMDAGYWWPYHSNDDVEKKQIPRNQTFPWRGEGLSILSFAEILEKYPDTALNVELKEPGESGARLLAAQIIKTGRTDILVVSEHAEAIKAFRRLIPEGATGASREEVIRFFILSKIGLEGFSGVKADALQVPISQGSFRIVTPSFIRAAHRRGLSVHVWTVNDPDEMDRLKIMGVDGIITDRPSLLAGKLK